MIINKEGSRNIDTCNVIGITEDGLYNAIKYTLLKSLRSVLSR